MSVLDSLNETSNKAVDVGEEFITKTQEYYKLKIFQQIVVVVSMLGKALIIGSLGFLSIVFLMVAGTIYLGNLLDNLALACLIIGAVLFLIVLIIYNNRVKIENAVTKKISLKFFN